MNVQLPDDIERDLLAAVRSGRFATVDDALAAAWRSFQPLAPAPPARKKATPRKKPAGPKTEATTPKTPMTRDEFHRHLLEIGLMSQLPDTAADFDDPDDVLIDIEGEPLSETVIRERR